MNVTNLEKGQLIRIWCKSEHSTLITWVASLVAIGEMIRFSNYTNYKEDWLVIDVDMIDTYENCSKKWGRDDWFLRKIEGREDEVVESNPTQTSIV